MRRKTVYSDFACHHCGVTVERQSSKQKYCRWECRLTAVLESFTDKQKCWEWPLSLCQGTGYGQINVGDKKVMSAPRAVMRLRLGQSAIAGLQVCHTCDNRKCVNPDHLFVGTAQDNVSDMIQKGRMARNKNMPRGENHHSHLNPEKVRRAFSPETASEILLANGSSRQLADRYGCSHSTILHIKRRHYYFGSK